MREWYVIFLGMGATLLRQGYRRMARRRAIEDTPTSRIVSAAAGEVELQGVSWPTDEGSLLTPSGRRAVAYEFEVMEERGSGKRRKWVTVFKETKCQRFLLLDATGVVIVEPKKYHIEVPPQTRSWRQFSRDEQECLKKSLGSRLKGLGATGLRAFFFRPNYRFREVVIAPAGPLFLHGHYSPRALGIYAVPYPGFAQFSAQAAAALNAPPEALTARFDTNGDGKLSVEEAQAGFQQFAQAAVAGARRSVATVALQGIRCEGVVGAGEEPLFLSDRHEHHLLLHHRDGLALMFMGALSILLGALGLIDPTFRWFETVLNQIFQVP